MTKDMFLIGFKAYTEQAMSGFKLPVRMAKGDSEQPDDREPIVYLMRLPNTDVRSTTQFAPYILHQLISARDALASGKYPPDSTCIVRTVFCVYDKDETTGWVALLQLMERMRIALLSKPKVNDQFLLDVGEGINYVIYPEIGDPPMSTHPYYLGEMVTQWALPSISREDGMHIWQKRPDPPVNRMS